MNVFSTFKLALTAVLGGKLQELRFLYLQEIQFNRRFTSKERHHYTYFCTFHVNLRDDATEVIERPIDNPDAFTNLESDFNCRSFSFHPFDDLCDLFRAQWGGIISHPNETRYPRCIAHHIPGLF